MARRTAPTKGFRPVGGRFRPPYLPPHSQPTLNPENRFSGRISWMYFLRRSELRGATTGLFQQTVQIVASHDLTLVVRVQVILRSPESHRNISCTSFRSRMGKGHCDQSFQHESVRVDSMPSPNPKYLPAYLAQTQLCNTIHVPRMFRRRTLPFHPNAHEL